MKLQAMKLLIDTHLLLRAAANTLPKKAIPYFLDNKNELYFSSASIWEVVIKKSLNRPYFQVDPFKLYKGLLDNGYIELNITSQHSLMVADLPQFHKDPFDRILAAQAKAEGIMLLTTDNILSEYSSTIFIEQ